LMDWHARHRRLASGEGGATDRLLRGCLTPLAALYGVAVSLRSALLRRAGGGRHRWPIATAGVGALAAGGSGKTPFAAFLALRLRNAGWRPLLVAHGYGAPRGCRTPRLLTDGRSPPREGWEQAGEESLLLHHLAPGIPILVSPHRRWGAAVLATGQLEADVAVFDGGFQDLRLHQDLRIAMVDASRRPGSRRLLPAGDLREPYRALRRADLLVLHRSERCSDRGEWTRWLDAVCPGQPRIWTRNRWDLPRRLQPAGAAPMEIAWEQLARGRWGVWTAIGRPGSFLDGLVERGVVPHWQRLAADHAPFGAPEARELRKAVTRASLAGVLVTEKDAIKLAADADRLPPVYVVAARLELLEGEAELDRLCEGRLRTPLRSG
ncbi:MAG: tetraacyldisaccharide 4'-kinase, partial [Candidatus Eisenbacteria bacterium]|nr:tetraacyldisaccharide 4'-kinase [Candidatus Eisenbacteria bacterium]